MRVALAILFGLVIFGVGFGSIRSLIRPSGPSEFELAEEEARVAAAPPSRTLFWCENCDAEIVVVRRGNGHGFRHCGEQMHAREEVLPDLN